MVDDKNGKEVTKPEFDYVAAMNDLMGLDIERNCTLREYDKFNKAVEEHGYHSKEALTRRLFIDLRKIGIAEYVLENFGFNLPEDYIFKDENGNEILTSKIILEKKRDCPDVITNDKKTKDYEKLYREYENLYWKELEENIELHDEIDKLEWEIRCLRGRIKSLEYKR